MKKSFFFRFAVTPSCIRTIAELRLVLKGFWWFRGYLIESVGFAAKARADYYPRRTTQLTSEDYGARLGATAKLGKRGTLIVSIDSLARMSSNPFFDFLMQRVEAGIGQPSKQGRPGRCRAAVGATSSRTSRPRPSCPASARRRPAARRRRRPRPSRLAPGG